MNKSHLINNENFFHNSYRIWELSFSMLVNISMPTLINVLYLVLHLALQFSGRISSFAILRNKCWKHILNSEVVRRINNQKSRAMLMSPSKNPLRNAHPKFEGWYKIFKK